MPQYPRWGSERRETSARRAEQSSAPSLMISLLVLQHLQKVHLKSSQKVLPGAPEMIDQTPEAELRKNIKRP